MDNNKLTGVSQQTTDEQVEETVTPSASEESQDSQTLEANTPEETVTEDTAEPKTTEVKEQKLDAGGEKIDKEAGSLKLEEKKEDQTSNTEPQDPSSNIQAPTPKQDIPGVRWYVVHTYSGHENKVAHTLKQRIESEHLGEKILDVLVPMQDKIEIRGGKKTEIKEKIFPGYILVRMVLDDISWLAVRTTQGVTSFVGMGNKPTPISDAEVATIIKFTLEEAPTYKQVFTFNDTVKIVDGPFADFIGKVDNVDEERGKVKVLVSIFGRETPVELDFLQVQKI